MRYPMKHSNGHDVILSHRILRANVFARCYMQMFEWIELNINPTTNALRDNEHFVLTLEGKFDTPCNLFFKMH